MFNAMAISLGLLPSEKSMYACDDRDKDCSIPDLFNMGPMSRRETLAVVSLSLTIQFQN
jgi:hypothetical protein